MNPGRTLTAAAALALAAVLGGCGIQKSDVVEAGDAATIAVQPSPSSRILLFFVDRAGGLVPVARRVDPPGPEEGVLDGGAVGDAGEASPDPGSSGGAGPAADRPRIATEKILAQLQYGPTPEERAAGLDSLVPVPRTEKHGFIMDRARQDTDTDADADTDGLPEIRLSTQLLVHDLEEVAVQQIVCTAAYAVSATGQALVTLVGTDGSLPPAHCG
ncbi:hypothetical protein EAO71_01705 [Streptomyces sp. ms191]|uniref:hypothetical protein n=1 Tax=unclassified Streptomyces TaxID=2593676 RepID=UPI0011CED1A2|nr:hypothetical protein [Streptomyces sp. ms191]TXS34314.1 hypothetical protein EAO71_01705 [Streptomyces sp. ms191]